MNISPTVRQGGFDMTFIWLFIYAINNAPQINWKAVDGWMVTLIICVAIDVIKVLGNKWNF